MANNNETWSTEKIIENADNWSLAGDVALLNTIKAFSDRLLEQSDTISQNVDNLLNNLNDVSLKLDLTKNKFHSLRNTQFIENRVYEDDESLESQIREESNQKNIGKPLTDEEKDKIIKESVMRGLEVMNKYYDKVEVSVSDSEEESDISYVLQPKDLYADRPLPYLIGSEEWYKKWHVGLLESSSESESEKEIEDTYSESDSENNLPKDNMFGSETSSELSFANTQNSNDGPPANSTFNDSVIQRKKDEFPSSDSTSSDYTNSLPSSKAPVSNQDFVEALAEKLGTVIINQENITPYVNKEPMKTSSNTNKFIGLFSDEPPPLDDIKVPPRNVGSDLFTSGNNLFDEEEEDDPFWNQHGKDIEKKKSDIDTNKSKLNQNEVPNKSSILPRTSQLSRGLFDSDDDSSSDDDIFSSHKKQLPRSNFKPFGTSHSVFDDKPPELKPSVKADNASSKKKPVGGVSIFGNTDIFSGKQPTLDTSEKQIEQGPALNNNKSVSQNTSDPEVTETNTSSIERENNNKEINDEISTKIKKLGLFDSDTESDTPSDKQIKNPKESLITKHAKPKKVLNLFDDSDSDTSLNITASTNTSEIPKPVSITKEEKSIVSTTKDLNKTSQAVTKKVSLFDDDDDLFKSDYDDIFSVDKSFKKKFTSSLFDDFKESEESDIFASTSQTKTIAVESETKKIQDEPKIIDRGSLFDDLKGSEDGDIFASTRQTKIESKVSKKVGLFDDLKDSADDDIFTSTSSTKTNNKRVGLFDDFEESEKPAIISGPSKINVDQPKAQISDEHHKQEHTSKKVSLESEHTDILISQSKSSSSSELNAQLEDSDQTKENLTFQKIQESEQLSSKTVGLFDDVNDSDATDILSNPSKIKTDVDQANTEVESLTKSEGVKEQDCTDVLNNTPKNNIGDGERNEEKPVSDVSEIVGLFDESSKVISQGDTQIDVQEKPSEEKSEEVKPKTKIKKVSFLDNTNYEEESEIFGTDNIEPPKDTLTQESFEKPEDSHRGNDLSTDFLSKSDEIIKSVDQEEYSRKEFNQAIEETSKNIEDIEKPKLMVTEATPTSNKSSDHRSVINVMPINLFDPTPPPVDDNWDSKSDSMSDHMYDSDPYDDISTQRSGIFDNEPPLLRAYNDSSGIGIDQNNTRFESDDSFYPGASSSRRLSSDIFSDQQSSDNFFITKNKTESLPSNLQSIPEFSRVVEDTTPNNNTDNDKMFEITPSGDVVDFLDSSTSFGSVFDSKKDGSLSTSNFKEENDHKKKKISLFGSDPEDTDDYDHPFSNKKQQNKNISKNQSNNPQSDNLFENVSVLPRNDEHGANIKESSSVEERSDKDTKSIEKKLNIQKPNTSTSKIADLTEKLSSKEFEKDNSKDIKPTSSPGKLKHNLNINVNALMPGFGPPKLRNTATVKSQSLDLGEESKEAVSVSSVSSVDLSYSTSQHNVERKTKTMLQDKPASFDDTADVEVLQSVTKDRAKIPIKRRPSTRRARQQSIIKSATEETLYGFVDQSVEKTIQNEDKNTQESTSESTSIIEKIDIEPEVKSIEEIVDVSKKIDTSNAEISLNKRSTVIDAFNSSSDEELFGSSSIKKQKKPKVKSQKTSLFSDDQDSEDDSLFSGKNIASSNKNSKNKSLFDDESDDDGDLFGTGDRKQTSVVTKSVERKAVKTSILKKLKNMDADDDPLSSLLK